MPVALMWLQVACRLVDGDTPTAPVNAHLCRPGVKQAPSLVLIGEVPGVLAEAPSRNQICSARLQATHYPIPLRMHASYLPRVS